MRSATGRSRCHLVHRWKQLHARRSKICRAETETVWAEPLAPGTSAQRAELIVLTRALTMAKDKRLNVYTDSRYAFATAHIHGAICRERRLLTAKGKTIKNKEEILDLLPALWLPKALAIIHCPGHQKSDTRLPKEINWLTNVPNRQPFLWTMP